MAGSQGSWSHHSRRWLEGSPRSLPRERGGGPVDAFISHFCLQSRSQHALSGVTPSVCGPLLPRPQGANTETFGPFLHRGHRSTLLCLTDAPDHILTGTVSVVGGGWPARSPFPEGPLHTRKNATPPQAPFSSKGLFIADSFSGIFHQADFTHSRAEGEGGHPGSRRVRVPVPIKRVIYKQETLDVLAVTTSHIFTSSRRDHLNAL